MIIIVNRVIPFKRFTATNLFGVVFVREDKWNKISDLQKTIYVNHESIHSLQERELLWIFFYLVYVAEWLFLLIKYKDSIKAYDNISFEKEAYRHELDLNYTDNRKPFAQWRKQ